MAQPSHGKRISLALREFFVPRAAPGMLLPNLRSAVISTVTIITCCVLFTPQLGVISMLGAMTPYWETGRPLWARIRNGALVSAALTASMAVGVLAAPFAWAIVPISVAVILVVGILYFAFMLTKGPSPVMMFYSAVIGTYFGADPSIGWAMVGVTAFASIFTSALLLIPLVFDPHGPENRSIASAQHAVDAYLQADASPSQRFARNTAFAAVSSAWLTLRSAWPADHTRAHRMLNAELMRIERDLTATVLERHRAAPSALALTSDPERGRGRPGWRFLLRRALRVDSVEWFMTWRMAIAAAIAGVLSQLLGVGHPYWAIITASIVINQWMDRIAATRRAAHRAVGTLIGVGIAWTISLTHPSPWWAVVIVVTCMIGMYVIFPMNYAIALMFITPMALVAVEASDAGANMTSLVGDRFIDTVIGAVAAVAVAWFSSRYFPRRLVTSQTARSRAATNAVEDAIAQRTVSSYRGQQARIELQYELIHHQSILERAVADDARLSDLASMEYEAADRGYLALSQTAVTRAG